MQFRRINEIEKKIVDTSLSKLNPKLNEFMIQKSKNLYICLNYSGSIPQDLSIFLISNELIGAVKKLRRLDDLVAVGLYLGFIMKSEFYLSLEGADYFYINNLVPTNRLLIANENGEKSILYGNDINKEMIVRFPNELHNNNVYIIINEQNELLALSIAIVSSTDIPNLKDKDVIARNLGDKGKYLRIKQ